MNAGIGQNRVVLSDKAERKFLGVLIVPFGADDVIVQAAGRSQPVVQAEEQVGVIDRSDLLGRTVRVVVTLVRPARNGATLSGES